MPSHTPAELSMIAAHVLGRLFLALDRSNYPGVASCFSAEGKWHRQGQCLIAEAAIVAALEKRPAGRRTLHVIANVVAEAAGPAAARATFYLIAYRHDGDAADTAPAPIVAPVAMGICEARLVATADGWRIAALRTGPDYMFKAAGG